MAFKLKRDSQYVLYLVNNAGESKTLYSYKNDPIGKLKKLVEKNAHRIKLARIYENNGQQGDSPIFLWNPALRWHDPNGAAAAQLGNHPLFKLWVLSRKGANPRHPIHANCPIAAHEQALDLVIKHYSDSKKFQKAILYYNAHKESSEEIARYVIASAGIKHTSKLDIDKNWINKH